MITHFKECQTLIVAQHIIFSLCMCASLVHLRYSGLVIPLFGDSCGNTELDSNSQGMLEFALMGAEPTSVTCALVLPSRSCCRPALHMHELNMFNACNMSLSNLLQLSPAEQALAACIKRIYASYMYMYILFKY